MVNEVRMEARAAATAASRERAKIEGEIAAIIQFIKKGIAGESVREELLALEARKVALENECSLVSDVSPLLHPHMADVWRAEITELRDALTEDRCDPEARQAVRDMVEEIRLTPRDGVLAVEVKGNLAAMLAAASPNEDCSAKRLWLRGRDLNPN